MRVEADVVKSDVASLSSAAWSHGLTSLLGIADEIVGLPPR